MSLHEPQQLGLSPEIPLTLETTHIRLPEHCRLRDVNWILGLFAPATFRSTSVALTVGRFIS